MMYAAGSPMTYGLNRGRGPRFIEGDDGYASYRGLGAITHEQAQAQAATDFQAHFGHPLPPRSLAEANWLNDRTAALKAGAGVETQVVTRTVRIDPRILGPKRINEISYAMQRLTALPHLKAQLGSALSAAQSMTTASIQQAERIYYQVKAQADAASHTLPHLSSGTTTVTSGGGVPSPPSGTASVLKNLSESLAKLWVKDETPPGPPQTVQPVGGVPYQPVTGRVPAQTSASPLDRRVGPFTVAQLGMGAGAVIAGIAVMRNIVPLAILGGVGAAGVWWAKQGGLQR